MNNWKRNIIIGAGIVVFIAVLCLIIKYQNDMLEKQELLEKSIIEQKQLTDNIIRSQSSLMTKKELKKYADDLDINLKAIQKDLDKLNGDVEGIQTIKVSSTGYYNTNIPSTTTTPNTNPNPIDPSNPDPFKYQSNRQVLSLRENFNNTEIPIGEVGFSAWQQKPWDVKILDREYNVVSVLGQDENGRHYTYNKFFINVDGKKYELKIDESKFVEKLPRSKFRFDPRLYAGMDMGAYLTQPSFATIPNLQIDLFSYGKVKPDPDWTFLGLGMGYEFVDNQVGFVVSPVQYNIGHNLPLVNNVFIRPTVLGTLQGDFAVMMGVGFGL